VGGEETRDGEGGGKAPNQGKRGRFMTRSRRGRKIAISGRPAKEGLRARVSSLQYQQLHATMEVGRGTENGREMKADLSTPVRQRSTG
jgi:hypothetical protein